MSRPLRGEGSSRGVRRSRWGQRVLTQTRSVLLQHQRLLPVYPALARLSAVETGVWVLPTAWGRAVLPVTGGDREEALTQPGVSRTPWLLEHPLYRLQLSPGSGKCLVHKNAMITCLHLWSALYADKGNNGSYPWNNTYIWHEATDWAFKSILQY